MTVSRVAFIDSRVADYQLLVAGLGADTAWFLINADEDGLAQMAQVLSQYTGLEAIDVISHGRSGALTLGGGVLDAASLDAYALQLQQIGASLAPNGDILLYGCDVGAGAAGQAFVDRFAALTGADVAASTDTTGAGGDWVLESTSGVVESVALELATYPGSLDTITGTSGNDSLVGTAGDDTLIGGAGNDTLDGGAGRDTVTYSGPMAGYGFAVTVSGDVAVTDTDTVTGGNEGVDALRSIEQIVFSDGALAIGVEADGLTRTISGDGVANTLTWSGATPISLAGGDGNDTLTGGAGADKFDGGTGADSMKGGGGDDVYFVDESAEVVTETTAPGVDTVKSSVNFTLSANVEALILLGGTNINGTGSIDANTITGNSGNNSLSGAGGNDTLYGGGGTDSFAGGTGDDTFYVDSTGDVITESAAEGTDTVYSNLSHTLVSNVENLVLTGSAANGAGNSEANAIYGTDTANTLSGGAGNDTLDGGAGTDTVSYSSPMAGYRFGFDGAGNVTVADIDSVAGGDDGTDTLHSVESVVFNDGGITLLQYGETRINTTTAYSAEDPSATALADGGYVVAWASYDGGQFDIYSQRYDRAGIGYGETRINSTTAGNQLYHGITTLADGGYVITWTSFGANGDVYSQRYDASGVAVGSETRINVTTAFNQDGPAITALTDGGYVVAWQSYGQSGADYDIYAQRYDAAGIGSGETRINTTTASSQTDPAVTALADGGYVVTWTSSDDIYSQRYGADGSAVGSETRINTSILNTQSDTAVTALADGGYVVAWASFENGGNIFAQRYDASGVTVGSETRINTATGSQNNPSITALVDDGYVVAWQSYGQDGSDYGIYAQRYDASGVAVGSERRINTTTDFSQDSPAITALADGGYVVTWASYNGGQFDIYSQRFDASGATVKLTGDSAANTVTWSANTSIAIDGSGGSDTLTGGDGSDFLQGGLGNDSLAGGLGTDTLVGGVGNDTYVVDSASDRATEGADEGIDLVRSSVSYTLPDNVENLTLSAGPGSSGTGNALANRITGNAGANTLDGGAGADTLIGSAGNDTYFVDSASDTVTETVGAGTDTVSASLNHTLAANVENLRLTGSAVSGTGNSSDNAMSGTDAANTLSGAQGNDTLDGGAGSDTLVGGTGNDTYLADVTTDVVTEVAGAGIDLVQSSLDWTLSLNVEQLLLLDGAVSGTGNAQNNTLTGNALSNVLSGLEGNDTLVGAGAGDTLIGGLGNDTYLANLDDQLIEAAGEGTDTVKSNIAWTLGAELENLSLGGPGNIGGTGNDLGNLIRGNDGNNRLQGLGGADTLIGGLGADLLDGGLQNDNLTGGVGADRLVGGDGNDTLIGAEDNDTLTGGVGADAFVFQSALGATNLDTVVDFAAGVDKLRLDDDVFAAFTVGVALTASQFVSGAGITAAQTADQRIVYNTTTGALYYDADGLNGEAAVQFAVLGSTTHPALSAGDFVIVG